MSSGVEDKYTFEFGELRHGKAAALAFAKVTTDFIRHFRGNPLYSNILESFIDRLLEEKNALSESILKSLEQGLSQRLNDILKEQREVEKSTSAKLVPLRGHKNHIDDGDEYEYDEEDEGELYEEDEEDEATREERERLEQERLEEEERKRNERYEALQRQKEENEARLRAKARKVDSSALERLRQTGAVVLNEGGQVLIKGKGGRNANNNKASQELSSEEISKLLRDVADVMRSKERVKYVLDLDSNVDDDAKDEKLKEALETAQQELNSAQETLTRVRCAYGDADKCLAPKVPSMNKGQISQLQQKLNKQNMEKNRLSLQLKALDAHPLRDELLSVLQQRDDIHIELELHGDIESNEEEDQNKM